MTNVSFRGKMKEKFIEYIFSKEFIDIDDVKRNFPDFLIEKFNASDILMSKGDIASEALILIKGECDVLNETEFSDFTTIDKLKAPHIIGYSEFLSEIENYTAYVIAKETCYAFRIKNDDLDNIVRNNSFIAYSILKMYQSLAEKSQITTEQFCIFSGKDILGHYLYNASKDSLPYKYPYYRSDLANQLFINLRTLYRYLDDFKEHGYITIVKGKIIISEKEFNKLKKRYGNIVL